MTNPTVWRFAGVVSSIVGFLCFGLSSSFPYMFGKWIWWKICVYGIFGIIICLVPLLAKERQRQTSPWRKANFAFSVFSIICVYTFFWDEVVKVKPDAYILISSTAFAILSFILSRLSPSGVAIDLLNFFCGNLIAQFMKIKLLLGFVGVGFSYSLFILRSRLDALADPVLPLQDTQLNPLLPNQLPVQDTLLNPVCPDQIPAQDTLNSSLADQLPVQDTRPKPVCPDQIPDQDTVNSLLPDQDTELSPLLQVQNDNDDDASDTASDTASYSDSDGDCDCERGYRDWPGRW